MSALATGITSVTRIGRVGEDPREEVGVGVGVVECDLMSLSSRVTSRGVDANARHACRWWSSPVTAL